MPSCAGAYVSGAAGSNACPAGSVRIETEAACRTAATAAGKTVLSGFVVAMPDNPRGCYFYTAANYAFFNSDPAGAGDSYYQLLCAASATTGAPPAAPIHTRGYTGAEQPRRGFRGMALYVGVRTRCPKGYACTGLARSASVRRSVVRCIHAVWALTRPAG